METHAIFTALREGNLGPAVEAILTNPQSLKDQDASGNYLAHLAAAAGILESVRNQLGPDTLELSDTRGRTVAHIAAANGSLAALAVVFKEHPHLLEWEDCLHETPVHIAARSANLSQIDWGLHFSALSHPNRLLETPTHIAIRMGDFESIARHVSAELLMLRDISGSAAYDEVARTAESRELVPAVVFAEAYRRLGRWSPEEMMFWMMGTAFSPKAVSQPPVNPIRELLKVIQRVRQIEDANYLEQLFQGKRSVSADSVRKQSLELAAREFPKASLASAMQLLRLAESEIANLPENEDRVTTNQKNAAKFTLQQLYGVADEKEIAILGHALGPAVGAEGKLRAQQRIVFCKLLADHARFNNLGEATQLAEQVIKNTFEAGCPVEWFARPLACLEETQRSEINRFRREHQEIVREKYSESRRAGNSPDEAFKLAENHLRSLVNRDSATSPVSVETLESAYSSSHSQSGPIPCAAANPTTTGIALKTCTTPCPNRKWAYRDDYWKVPFGPGMTGAKKLKYGIRLYHVAAAYECLAPLPEKHLVKTAKSNAEIFAAALDRIRILCGENSCARAFYVYCYPKKAVAKPFGSSRDHSFAWMDLREPEGQTAHSIFAIAKAANQAATSNAVEFGTSLVGHWYLPIICKVMWQWRNTIMCLDAVDLWGKLLEEYGKKIAKYRPCFGFTFLQSVAVRLGFAIADYIRERGPVGGSVNRRRWLITRAVEKFRGDNDGKNPSIGDLAEELEKELDLPPDKHHGVMSLRKILSTCGIDAVTWDIESPGVSLNTDTGFENSLFDENEEQRLEMKRKLEVVFYEFELLPPGDRTFFLLYVRGVLGDSTINTKALAKAIGINNASIISKRIKDIMEELVGNVRKGMN